MTHPDAERRPGLGESFFAVYGVTRGMCEMSVSRSWRGFLAKAMASSRDRIRNLLKRNRPETS